MTHPDDLDDAGSLGYVTREGPVPKLVVVAIVWAGFGVFGLFTAMLMHSSGFAVFGVLCIVAGVALYVVQRTRDQLVHDELNPSPDPWTPPPRNPVDAVDDPPAGGDDSSASPIPEAHDDILDAEYTEYFDWDPPPADQDDGTGYDDEDVAYQRYQAGQWARQAEAEGSEADESDESDESERDGSDEDEHDASDEHDDVARTSRIHTGDGEGEPEGSADDPEAGTDSGTDSGTGGDHEGADGSRR